MPKHLGEKEGCLMEKEARKSNGERPGERVDQFIIECLFNKYFEERKDSKVRVREEKVRV